MKPTPLARRIASGQRVIAFDDFRPAAVSAGSTPPPSAVDAARLQLAEWHYAERRRRGHLMPADLFGEPAWDILLDLYIAMHRGRTVNTSSACVGADVPPTTALRWIMLLEERGLVKRSGDSRDHRRTLVRLSRHGEEAVTRWLDGGLVSMSDLGGQ